MLPHSHVRAGRAPQAEAHRSRGSADIHELYSSASLRARCLAACARYFLLFRCPIWHCHDIATDHHQHQHHAQILKKTDCLSHKAPEGSVDLYVLEATPQPPPPSPPWGWLWPIPSSYNFDHDGQLSIGQEFHITTTASSPRLARAIARYASIINASVTQPPSTQAISTHTAATSHDGAPKSSAPRNTANANAAVMANTANANAVVLASLNVVVDVPSEELPSISTDYSYTLTVTSSPTPMAEVRHACVLRSVFEIFDLMLASP